MNDLIPELLPVVVPSLTSMTSNEIAALVQSRPSNVTRSIRRLMESGVISQRPMVERINHLGQTVSEYVVDRRDTYVVVAQLSPAFTGRLVDRWQELESAVQALRSQQRFSVQDLSISDVSDLMITLLEHESGQLYERVGSMVRELVNQHAPLERVNQVVENADDLLSPSQIGFTIGVSPQRVNRILLDLNLQIRGNNGLEPTPQAGGLYEEIGRRTSRGEIILKFKWKRRVIDHIPTQYLSR